MQYYLSGLSSYRRRGFSSAEFFATTVIAMIVTVMAFAGYRVYQKQMPVKYMSQRLVHGFSAARAFAIAHNSTYAVQIDTARRTWWIDQTDENGSPIVHKVVAPEAFDPKVDIEGFQFATLATPTSSTLGIALPVRFFADGSSDDVHLFLRMKSDVSTTNTIYTVRLYGPTGLSHLFERQRL